MPKPSSVPAIRLRGVRHNNLKNFDLDLPLRKLIVVTGLSGSGKSSLAFDTLYAEGQRRYIETFSPYARQFFDRMDKPQVDSIEGIPPAIAIEQRNAVRSTRSTVGTMTEICDHLKVLWPHLAPLHCRTCGQRVRKEPPQEIWKWVMAGEGKRMPDAGSPEVLVTFDVPLSEKLSLGDSLALLQKQGYQRLLLAGAIVRLEDAETRLASDLRHPASAVGQLTVIQDRLRLTPANRSRFTEACEQAYHFGKGRLAVLRLATTAPSPAAGSRDQAAGISEALTFSNRLHCAHCDVEYREPSPALFSFNHPLGACPKCKGFGRVISIDHDLAIPDRSLTLAQGAVKPWRSGFSAECLGDLKNYCKIRRVPMDVPFRELEPWQQDWVLNGDKDYGMDEAHQWPRAWYGVKGYFKWLESKAYKMHVRVLLSRYRAYTTCPDCEGRRLQPDALLYLLKLAPTLYSLADFYALPVDRALAVIEQLATPASGIRHPASAFDTVLQEVRARLAYLVEVGLGYLTLDRPTRTLSGGETERVNLTTCLGTRLVNTLFVLDEPSVGLHPRDTVRLIRILEKLRDTGNTVVVVEHEASVMRAADEIVDLGPGHGATGGEVVFQGPVKKLLQAARSLTGAYLSGRKAIAVPQRRAVTLECGDSSPLSGSGDLSPDPGLQDARQQTDSLAKGTGMAGPGVALTTSRQSGKSGDRSPHSRTLILRHATRHNLKDLTVKIPLGRFVCLTGVSGSGKTTLVREILLPALQERLGQATETVKASDRLDTDEGGDREQPEAAAPDSACVLTGAESLSHVVLVDQSPLGKTPRSNPAVYIGAFDDLRELYAQTEEARQRGLNASAFSFNSTQGQCERCRGAGFEKIEMQFLSDVFIRCPECNGRRYREHILEVKLRGRGGQTAQGSAAGRKRRLASAAAARAWSIADLLEATVDEVIEFLGAFPGSRHAARATRALGLLQEVGLGYLKLGQPINTLSGGESQRLKLVAHLAESGDGIPQAPPVATGNAASATSSQSRQDTGPALFLFDEPTTGLHFEDVRVLLLVFQRLVDAGHSVLVIEHNLEVIKCADWVIDLGPEAGERGGQLVAAGTPEDVAKCAASHTGTFLRELLPTAAPITEP